MELMLVPRRPCSFFVLACERNPDLTGRLSIPNVLRVKEYSEDEAVNCTLQMQVRREVKAAAAAMIMLSTTATITTTMTTATTINTISSEALDTFRPH
jgi:hypothetical protein